MSKIIGVTVGTPISPERLHDKLNFVKTINNMAPDENGNVEIEVSGGNVDLDTTLSQSGKAADAKAVGDAIADVRKEVASGVTNEQIDTAVSAYLSKNPVSGGMSATASALLAIILRNAMYSADQSANITALEAALASSGNSGGNSGDSGDNGNSGGETETVTYAVTNNLTNVVTNNANTVVNKNSAYTATLTAVDGYELETVTVFMGGVDITNTAHTNGFITIPQVTGNITITATAVTSAIATEELTEIVDVTGWPEPDADGKWAYTEGGALQVAFLPVEIYGGTLTVEFNPEECNSIDISVRTAYADGKAAHTSSGSLPNVTWVVAGEGAATGKITASPAIYDIPDGEKAMVIVRRSGEGTIVTSNSTFKTWVHSGGIKCTVTGKRG